MNLTQGTTMIQFTINGKAYSVDMPMDTPILWVLREHLNLTGTKFGCGAAQCGACTVLLDNEAIRSCSTPISEANGKHITTIETTQDKEVKALQSAWVAHDVAQCGYCQPGQIINAAALLKKNPHPNETEIVDAMRGNICRCGTYNRIKSAITTVAKG